mmetsp:Transcript_6796/g.11947  ORF Transcript_6796/g.11947 Transcript_6796/m.11947 type:complete len:278 (-) Transcript_6796:70-903(-)
MEGTSAGWSGAAAFLEKARKAVAETAQAAQEGMSNDLESGGAGEWMNWARNAAERARQNVAETADGAWQVDVASAWGKVTENAAGVGAGFSEIAGGASQRAFEVAGTAKAGLQKAGSNLGAGISGMGALATSPTKLFQFAGIFMLGMILISMSFSFLPMLPIKPQKFALLFGLGSLTVLGSLAWLRGPAAFMETVMQRDKLPFSVAYAAGLLGTLWATLIARSYVFTAIFALLQTLGLLYFLASFVPGGKAVLNFIGRMTTKWMQSLFTFAASWRKS